MTSNCNKRRLHVDTCSAARCQHTRHRMDKQQHVIGAPNPHLEPAQGYLVAIRSFFISSTTRSLYTHQLHPKLFHG